jgi:hypothetical protein
VPGIMRLHCISGNVSRGEKLIEKVKNFRMRKYSQNI